MSLYQPTASEIAAALAKAVTNFPHIAGDARLDRAATLLAAIHTWIVWTDKETVWQIPSCSNPARYWQLEGNRGDCPDFRAKTVLVDSQPVCKHSLALRAYRYIILSRLTEMIAQDGLTLLYNGYGHFYAYRGPAEFRIWRKFNPNTGQPTGPHRFKTDYDLSAYAAQLHAEVQPDYAPPAFAFHNGIPIAVPARK